MGSTQPLTPPDRDRALARLGRVTTGTGIGALLAVGGFSYVAAASYSGKHVTTSTVAPVASMATPSASATTDTATGAPIVVPTVAPAAAPTAPPVAVSGGS